MSTAIAPQTTIFNSAFFTTQPGCSLPLVDTNRFVGTDCFPIEGLIGAIGNFDRILVKIGQYPAEVRTVNPVLKAFLRKRCALETERFAFEETLIA